MKAFRYRQAYAMVNARKDAGELPEGLYKFVVERDFVRPSVRGASLTPEQVKTLEGITQACVYEVRI